MISYKDLLEDVVRPVLSHLDMNGLAAEQLVVGTAVHESTFNGDTRLRQVGGGPALGIYQIEPNTMNDVWNNFLKYRPVLREKIEDLCSPFPNLDQQLAGNLFYATAICRLVYYRQREPLPKANDLRGLAAYWKKYYNTVGGKGSPQDWLEHFNQVSGLWT